MPRIGSRPLIDSSVEHVAPSWGQAALRSAIVASLICAGYYAAGAIGIALRFEPGGISGVWLPQGILLAALLLVPVRQWWLIAAALLPVHLYLARWFQGSGSIWIILIQYGGNLIQAALSAAVLQPTFGHPPRLNTLSRMGAFIAAAFLMSGLVSALVVWLFVATHWVGDFWIAWQRRALAQTCAAVVIAAPLLQLATSLDAIARAAPRRVAEYALLTAGLAATLFVSFGWASTYPLHLWLLFAPLPMLLWSAVR